MSAETGNFRPGREEHGGQAKEAGHPRGAVGAARLIPAVTFGLRAAVLAGVVLVSSPGLPQAAAAPGSAPVLTTMMLSNAASGMGLDETTCCSNNPQS
jgi:hypothetical protein